MGSEELSDRGFLVEPPTKRFSKRIIILDQCLAPLFSLLRIETCSTSVH